MATEPINADVNILRSIMVDRDAGVPPVLSIGQLIRFSVRENGRDGQGQIFLNGKLIPAALPPLVKEGETIVAKVVSANDQILFQIVDRQAKPTAGGVQGIPLREIAQQIERTLTSGTQLSEQPFPILEALKNALAGRIALPNLIPSSEQLTDARFTLAQLKNAAEGEFAQVFREVAQTLRDSQLIPQRDERLLVALKQTLAELVDRSASDNRTSARQLNQLVSVLMKELADDTAAAETGGRRALNESLRQLRNAASSPEPQILNQLKETISNIDQSLQPLLRKLTTRELSTAAQSGEMAQRLETLATTHQDLAKVNPLMHALGEPALILFPFLAHGLLTHSQVTIEPPPKNEDDQHIENESGESGEQYQRIQVTVPLPNLGPIGVDIAHRTKEIFVRLTTENEKALPFLLNQLEQLTGILRGLGFSQAELTAGVGQPVETIHPWANKSGSYETRA